MMLGVGKKFYSMRTKDFPLIISTIALAVILILWFFAVPLRLAEESTIVGFRANLQAVGNFFYLVVTLWLVLVTRKMAEVSLNAQKAANRPEILCELYIDTKKPSETDFQGIKRIELMNTEGSRYEEGISGAGIFLILKNRYGGGKAIDINIDASFEANSPDTVLLDRPFTVDYLAEGDCIAVYLYRFEKPSLEDCFIKLKKCSIGYTTPFGEASKDSKLKIEYGKNNPMLATGNLIGAIKLGEGVKINK